MSLSNCDLIKDYTLVGGTALSIQINSRISEDLNFCIWQDRIGDVLYEVKWAEIEKYLENEFENVSKNLIDLQQVNFLVDGVKLTFFVRENINSSHFHERKLLNSIDYATVESLGAMKLELLQRRNIYWDYYDIYSILKEGVRIHKLIDLAVEYSKNKLKSKTILSILSNAGKFRKEENFDLLNPKYKITSFEIRDYIIDRYKEEFNLTS